MVVPDPEGVGWPLDRELWQPADWVVQSAEGPGELADLQLAKVQLADLQLAKGKLAGGVAGGGQPPYDDVTLDGGKEEKMENDPDMHVWNYTQRFTM